MGRRVLAVRDIGNIREVQLRSANYAKQLEMGMHPKFWVRVIVFGSSSVNVGFGSVQVLHRWNWEYVYVVVICYGLTVIVSTS